MASKKVLLFGLGFFQRRLLKMLADERPCVVVDINGDLVERVTNEYSNVTGIEGEASSIVIWKKINLEDISHIVSSLQDFDVVLEICRIARQVYNLQIPIVLMLYKNDRREELEQFDVKVINPILIASESVLNIIQKNYARPNNIGLGNGEIVEVIIRRRSHIVDRKMRFLAPSRWKVAAVYRNASFIVPDGDFKLQIGDRVVLTGGLVERDSVEINYFFNNTKAKKYLWYDTEHHKVTDTKEIEIIQKAGCEFGGTLKNFRSAAYLHDVGTLAVSGSAGFGLFNRKLKYYFKKTHHPILICRGRMPYNEVLVLLNGSIPERLIETGAEVAAHFGVPCRCIYVVPPGALKTNQDTYDMESRKNFVRDYENLTRTKILEGNPVHKVLSEVDDKLNNLLIVSANSKDSISFLNPHTSFLIASRTNNSVLVLPDEDSND